VREGRRPCLPTQVAVLPAPGQEEGKVVGIDEERLASLGFASALQIVVRGDEGQNGPAGAHDSIVIAWADDAQPIPQSKSRRHGNRVAVFVAGLELP
jgi:hypothetical protein